VFIVAAIFSIVLAVLISGSAYAKLTKNPTVVESIVGKVGFPEERLWVLAGLELAGAAGLIIGLFWAPLGIAAAIGVVLYFIGAIIGHVRAGDTASAALTPPAIVLVVSVITLVLRIVTA
jgi:hypothetical protein